MNLSRKLNEKTLLAVSLVIVAYFVMLYLIHLYAIDAVLIGVFVEVLTLPFLLAQIVFLIIGILFLIERKSKQKHLVFLSILLLGVCSFVTISSFFYN